MNIKRIPITLTIIVLTLLSFTGCEKEENGKEGPKIETLSAVKGTHFVVSLTGRVSGLDGVALDFECGIEYSTDASFSEDKTIRQKVNKKYSEDPFSITLIKVTPGQKYYYRAYYISQLMVYYGVTKEFSFTWDAPQVTTISAELVDLNTAMLYGSINGLEDILNNYSRLNVWYGIQFSTSKDFESSNIYYANRDNSQTGDTISCIMSYFRYNTKYYYRTFFSFYFSNVLSENMLSILDEESDIYYGEIKEVVFTCDPPKVTTLSAELSKLPELNGEEVIECKGLIDGIYDIVKNNADSSLHYGIQYSTSASFNANATKTSFLIPLGYKQMGDTIVGLIPMYDEDYSGQFVVEYNTVYYYRAFFNYRGLFEVGETKTFKITSKENGSENGYDYVEMGLSVKWATFNVGASKPEEYGNYYAWGEIEPKTDYSWSTYKWCNGSSSTLTKYNNDSDCGTVDDKTTLEPEDDVAHVKWGGNWRMPTNSELDELNNNCTWTLITVDGVKGYMVTSKKSGYTDRSIFLPLAGSSDGTDLVGAGDFGCYWSSSLYLSYSLYPGRAYYSYFDIGYNGTAAYKRYYGHSVRPVCP